MVKLKREQKVFCRVSRKQDVQMINKKLFFWADRHSPDICKGARRILGRVSLGLGKRGKVKSEL